MIHFSKLGGRKTVYVCENNVCKFPMDDLKKARKLVKENKKYSLN